MKKSSNIVWHHACVTRDPWQQLTGHRSAVVRFTGLSGSGDSTRAHAIEDKLYQVNCHTFVLDGDDIRHGLCGDLGFSDRRAGAIHNFTGTPSPYEEPEDPELVVDTGNTSLAQCVEQITPHLYSRGIIPVPQQAR